MAAGSVTVAALRHRPRQAVLVVVLAAVVTAAAALGPLYARAVEQSLLRTVVAEATPAQSTLVVSDASDRPASPRELARTVRGALPAQFGRPVGGADTDTAIRVGTGRAVLARSRLASRDRLCGHVTVSTGRCARAAGEVLVSVRTAAATGIGTGDVLSVTGGDPTEGGVTAPLTVVGLYDGPDLAARYWAGRGRVPVTRPATEEQAAPTVDDLFTPWATLAADPWPDLHTHLDVPLLADRLDLDTMPAVTAATRAADAQARTLGASATSSIRALLASTTTQRDQARTVIPLLAVQLAVLGIVVLAFVCAAATEQRRPEIALARLRGHGSRGAVTLLLRELGLLAAAGTLLGAALGWLTAQVATWLWLRPGITLEARWPLAAAVAASFAAALLAILVAAAPTLRQPLTSLLRRVPPRATTLQVGLVEGAVVAAAAAGVVTLLAGDGGPVALLAPGLLAVAGGLLLAQATIPTAGPLARAALRRGRLPWALAALQIARRPALRRLIAIITVGCALAVFAADAWAVADRNRTTRAQIETGAPVVLTVDAESSLGLRRAMLDIDPHGAYATPVVTVSSATEAGPRTTAVEPAAFARMARWGAPAGRPTPEQIAAISPTLADPVRLTGDRVVIDAIFEVTGVPRVLDGPEPELGGPLRLRLRVADRAGVLREVDLGRLRAGNGRYSGRLDCGRGCNLAQVAVERTFGDFVIADVDLRVTRLRTGTAGSLSVVDLDNRRPGAWQGLPDRIDPRFDSSIVEAGTDLHLSGSSFGAPVGAQRGDRPVRPVALRVGNVTRLPPVPGRAGPLVAAPDTGGRERSYSVAGRLPQVPRSGGRGVLVGLAGLVEGPSAAPGSTSYDVWLAADDTARETTLRRDLAEHGLQVLARDTEQDHVAALESEGPALALRLALLAGVVAVVLAAAALVVGVATSGASRARDLAGLRVVGVPARTVRRASVREHLVVVVLGVLAGSVLGLAAAQAALPDIPLSATPDRLLAPVLAPAWGVVAATAAGALVLLCIVSVVVGRSLAAAAVPARLREGR